MVLTTPLSVTRHLGLWGTVHGTWLAKLTRCRCVGLVASLVAILDYPSPTNYLSLAPYNNNLVRTNTS